MQGAALLGADPSVFVQAGAVRVHMHVEEVEQDLVEEVSVLKYREDILKHPRGAHDHDTTPAFIPPHPNAVAPSSHSASLPAHAPPISSVQNPDVRATNTFAALAPRTPEAAAHAVSQTVAAVAAARL